MMKRKPKFYHALVTALRMDTIIVRCPGVRKESEWSEFVLIKTFLDNRRKDFFIIIKNERKFELIIINY